MTYARKVDANAAEIIKTLRQCGWSVLDLSRVGQGCPDVLCAKPLHATLLAEIKVGKKKLNKRQQDFHRDWKGRIVVLRSVQDALELRP